jgi:isopentenyl-diphosphate delta-isomerase
MLGAELREWGVPTAAALIYARRAGFQTIASGGIRGALDAVRALALGAQAVSLALPFLRAHAERGEQGVFEAAEGLCEGVRALMLLTGTRHVAELSRAPRVIGSELAAWLDAPGPRRAAE